MLCSANTHAIMCGAGVPLLLCVFFVLYFSGFLGLDDTKAETNEFFPQFSLLISIQSPHH